MTSVRVHMVDRSGRSDGTTDGRLLARLPGLTLLAVDTLCGHRVEQVPSVGISRIEPLGEEVTR